MVEIWWLSCLFSYVQLNHRLLFLFAFAAAAARSILCFPLSAASTWLQSIHKVLAPECLKWFEFELKFGLALTFEMSFFSKQPRAVFPNLMRSCLRAGDLQIKKRRMTREVLSIEQNINCRMDKITKLESIDP